MASGCRVEISPNRVNVGGAYSNETLTMLSRQLSKMM